MLALAIIATVILGIKILLGWFCKAIIKSADSLNAWQTATEHTKGFILANSSWGIINAYMIAVIWILYANIG